MRETFRAAAIWAVERRFCRIQRSRGFMGRGVLAEAVGASNFVTLDREVAT
jgi:hypothetical protein